jgi:VWFA-related protein
MLKNRFSWLLITLMVAAPALSATAQEKKQDQGEIKLRTELVQIDVLVTDKNNKPVAGLKREDFELFDNNKRQQISNFAYEQTNTRRVSEATTETRSLPRAISAGDLKRVIAFVVDTLHIKYENIYRTRKMLEDFVDNKMQPGDLVLILPTGGGSGVLQQFTSDQRLLHRAIDRLRPFYFSNDTTPYRSFARMGMPTMSNPGMGGQASTGRGPAGVSMPRGAPSILGTPDPLEEADVRATLDALKQVIKSMGKLPGRKVSVFVSEGIRFYATQATNDLNQTTALAAQSNVVFYTVDPRGLDTLSLEASDQIDTGGDVTEFLNNKRSDFHESQDSLRAIAADTGGKFFGNNNDIKRGLDSVLDENSAYYMLGFYPESGHWDGKIHKVKVVVRERPDLTVTFHKSYLAKSLASEYSRLDPKLAEAFEAIMSPLVRRDIDLRLTPLYIDNTQREPVVTLLLHIDASKLHFTQAEGRYQTKLDEFGLVFDATGKAVDKFSNTLDMNLLPQTYEGALRRGFVATRILNLKPGTYQIRMFLREIGSGLIGTANDYIDIPNIKVDRFATSSLFLSGQTIQDGKIVTTAGENSTPSQRRFKAGSEFSYSLVIYNAKLDSKSKQPQLEMRMRVLRGSKVEFDGQWRPVTIAEGSAPPARIITGGITQLGKLGADDYTLEATVRDKLRGKESRSTVRQEIDFSVE